MFRISDGQTSTVIQLESDIVGETSEKLRLLIKELVEKGVRSLRFDMTAVKDMDPSALCIFFLLPDTMLGAELEIAGATEDIANMFEMTKLSQRYNMSEPGPKQPEQREDNINNGIQNGLW